MRWGSYDDAPPNSLQLKTVSQRRRSAPSLIISRALSISRPSSRENALLPISLEQCPFVLGLANLSSELIMADCVELTVGTKTKGRHLFLFNDMLVIAKSKSSSFRLKQRINICELWTATCFEEVSESAIHQERSFVIGWPVTNCVVTFNSSEIKERWHDNLHRQIQEAKENEEPNVTSLTILMKVLSNSALSKTLTVSNMEPASEVVKRVLQESAEMGDAQNYQLVLSNNDDLSTSLIGHEYPFAIKMNQLHKLAKQQAKCDVPALKLERKPSKTSEKPQCQFQLKPSQVVSDTGLKHCKKNRTKMPWPFRKNSARSESVSSQEEGLFDRHLKDICDHDDMLPKPILKGPSYVGIFRKSANAKACKDLIGKLNAAREVTLEEEPVIQLAAVFKNFLRRIPDSVLVTELYDSWMAAMEKETINERTEEIKQLMTKLPSHNRLLLHYLFCVLYYINKHSEVNRMDAHNLAVCIGPNMLWPNKPATAELQKEVSAKVVALMQILIENCCLIFGDDITTLLGEPAQVLSEYSDMSSSHQNDSAYDSTDQDDWKDVRNEKRRRANSSCYQLSSSNEGLRMERKQNGQMDIEAGDCTTASCSTESIDATNRASLRLSATTCPSALIIEQHTGRINRRCSEPILAITSSPKKINQQELVARSHDDCSIPPHDLDFNRPPMRKQMSEGSFPKYQSSSSRLANLNASSHSELSTASSSKASSISSLTSSWSNLSENSVFTSSPLASPTCPSQENASFSEYPAKLRTISTKGPDSCVKPSEEKAKKKPLKKTQSWGPTRSFSTNQESCKENVLKENLPTCETVHEDQVSESDPARCWTQVISTDEVFQRVDSKKRCSPPSYTKAVQENNPPVATMKGMTVKNMRRLSQLEETKSYLSLQNEHKIFCCLSVAGQKNRPSSLTEDLLYPSCQNHITAVFDSCDKQAQSTRANQCEALHVHSENGLHSAEPEKTQQYRGRAMSESASRDKHERSDRWFSQTFDGYKQIQHAKESYV
ncbi:T cell activation RhoGTPase activating protein b isoform X2 [Heptranchias perlo]|uniref:T cell activation RhoGTPase activating protein b isoform X2 n=1 Tax=Heptranchias perlo TaxID=212740 RepID=UPI00355A8F9E